MCGLFVPSSRRVAHTDCIDIPEKTRRIRPDAEILAQFLGFASRRFGHPIENSLLARSPRPRVRLRIIHRKGPLKVVAVDTMERFLQSHLIAVDVTIRIEPGSFIKTV